MMTDRTNIVIVGAGPAGVRAAQTLVEAGQRPVVLDENARWGGQIYRQPPEGAGFRRAPRDLYGFEARKAQALHATMARLLPSLDYRPHTLAWACETQPGIGDAQAENDVGAQRFAGYLATLCGSREQNVPFTHLVIASGATDRVLPMPGWTLPGVYTLGAAQTALKSQGCAIGKRIVFAGTGPLLYLVAYQYAKAGANVLAVLDTNDAGTQAGALPKLAALPSVLAKGLYYVGWLRAHGVRIERGVSLEGVLGETHVAAITWRSGATSAAAASADAMPMTLECDAVGLGFGLRPETQLADTAGCRFRYDTLNRCWLPERDEAGRTSIGGIYVAGDGAGIAGADAAELAGRLAALAVLDDVASHSSSPRGASRTDAATSERRALRRVGIFRAGIEAAFPTPFERAATWPDAMTVCRCEEIDAGAIRQCIRSGAASEINRLKALTRAGMGRCQGRMCGEAALALLAVETQQPFDALGRLRAQAPIKPIPLAAALSDERVAAVPEDARDE
jgi:NADPH-dependent 2,4-dienoyl-CoA reductase/sulfur reductase-like enzyme